MKVTIQQVVELEEVPFRTNGILLQAIEQLKALSHAAGALDVTKIDDFLKNLDFLRKRMFQVDARFEECASLIYAYQKTLEQATTGENKNENPDEHAGASDFVADPKQQNVGEVTKNLPTLESLKNTYNKLLEENYFDTNEPLPTFPNIDLSSLTAGNKVEEILKDE